MKKLSRRELARSVASQLQDGADSRQLMRSVAAYLIDHKMLNQTDMLLSDVADELQRTTGHVSAEVRAAYLPGADAQMEIQNFIREMVGATSVELQFEEDPSLVGGVVIRAAGREYDASVRRKLNQLATGVR
jgi:F0F1-type ATP synthase delta subunit